MLESFELFNGFEKLGLSAHTKLVALPSESAINVNGSELHNKVEVGKLTITGLSTWIVICAVSVKRHTLSVT